MVWLVTNRMTPPRPNRQVVCDSDEMEPVVTQLMRGCTGLLQSCRLPGALHLRAQTADTRAGLSQLAADCIAIAAIYAEPDYLPRDLRN
jgi:hypothetical protein